MNFIKKKVKSNKLAKRFIFLIGLLIVISAISSNRIENQNDTASNDGYIDGNNDNGQNRIQIPKPAGYWSTTYIHIYNDNWSNTPLPYIQVKSGTWNDPHIIENVSVNPNSARSAILIYNCKQFFAIRNCSITKSASGNTNAGILLNNTVNGTILANNIYSNNGCGIILSTNCKNNTIVNNTINSNSNRAISFVTNCDRNSVINNTIKNNNFAGVYMDIGCDYNNITDNYIYNSNTGFDLIGSCTYNKFINNTVEYNSRYEVYIESSGSDHNDFINNTFENSFSASFYHGVYLMYGAYEMFRENTFIGAGFFMMYPTWSSLTIDNTNTINGKILYYYYNKNYLMPANFTNGGAIILANCQHCKASNLDVSEATVGVKLYTCNNITLTNITANDAQWGMWLDEVSNSKILDCEVYNNEYDGIIIQGDCDYNNISNCEITSNNDSGIKMTSGTAPSADFDVITNCTITSNENGIWYENDCYNTTISKNAINSNSLYGIYSCFNTRNSKIINNTMSNNGRDAINFCYDCLNNIIANNTIDSNDQSYYTYNGITIYDNCYGFQILNNIIKSNKGSGVSIGSTTTIWDPSYNNIVSGNTIVNNEYDGVVVVDRCNSNKITYNNISKNVRYGIYIYKGCNFTTVSNNNITYNAYGIYLDDRTNNCTINGNLIKRNSNTGIRVNTNTCRNSTITNNYFVKNTIHARDNGQNNKWNSNFWDDYFIKFGGEDLNKDKIGDIPYIINASANIKDNFPIWAIYRPVIFVNAPSNITWDHIAPFLNVQVIDPYSHIIKYQIQTSNYTLANDTDQQINLAKWATLPEGQYIVIIHANNTYGMPNSTKLVLFKDTKAPLLMINLPLNKSVSNAPPTINLTAYDPNFQSLWYNIQGVNFTLTNKTEALIDATSWNALPYGLYTVKLYANDTFGHLNNSLVLKLYKDTHAPTIRVNSPANGSSSFTPPFINLSSFDLIISNAYIWFEFQGVNYTVANNTNRLLDTTAWNSIPEGTYYSVYLFANDTFGYLNNSLHLWLYKEQGPNIVVNSPVDYSASNSAPYLNVTVYTSFLSKLWYDFRNVNYTLTNNSQQQLSASEWNLLTEGSYNMKIYANDTLGRLSQKILYLYKDITKPSLSIVLPSNYTYWNGAPLIQVVVMDLIIEKIWCVINNTKQELTNNVAALLASSIWNALLQGLFTIHFYANDTAGNLNDSITIQLYKDTIGPSLVIVSPIATDWTTAPPINVTTNSLDLNTIWYVINGKKEELTNNTQELVLDSIWNALSYGPFTLTIYANDTIGNIESIALSLNKIGETPGDDDSGDSADDEIPPIQISFGSYYLPILLISIVCCVAIVRLKLVRRQI